MGARLLRRYLEKPLVDITAILKRQASVTAFYNNDTVRAELRDTLANIKDIERLIAKVVYDTINPRDVKSLGNSLNYLPAIKSILSTVDSPVINKLNNNIDALTDIAALIERTIVDEAPVTLRDGKAIKDNYSPELAELKSLLKDSKEWLSQIEISEKERTGIKTLKVGYNKIFGYYIEVSNSFSNMVPEDYIRKQTLVNGERYITAELKDLEAKMLTAGERVIKLENEIFEELKSNIKDALSRIKPTADAVAELDVHTNFAEISKKNGYVCPVIVPEGIIDIKNGRHPVVEKALKHDLFVPNDTYLDNSANMFALITGPNMAGKSTYMRQVAVIVIMAQTGCYVPADYAKIAVVDKIFTRVGASDDLSAGQSTFMVEMSEVAYILKNATKNSLLIFDEIGRGTSTFDGMSMAQAVIEYVVKKIKAKTMFATHYHELTRLDKVFDSIKNYNVAAKKKNNEIIFLRKILKGGTDDSYGIDVAKLAGVPNDVIKRAEEILKELEENKVQIMVSQKNEIGGMYQENNLFSDINNDVVEKLKNIDITTLTPIEAMNELYKLSNAVKGEKV
jgi:DNA mismatch repair protein MutS